MKCIAGLFLLAATGMAQALLAPVESQSPKLPVAAAEPVYKPMTGSERWHQFLHQNITGPGAYLRPLKTAAFQEMSGRTYDAWPATTGGFAKRWASSFGRNLAQNGITDAMASALRHDTRYHSCLCDGKAQRVKHALLMSIFTHDRNGNRVWDASRFSGLYGGALVSMSWRPHNGHPALESARIAGFGFASTVLTNVAREFAPDLKRRFRRGN